LLAQASLILTMTVNQRDSLRRMYPEFRKIIRTIGEMAGEPDLDVADPFGGGVEAYQQTAAALLSLIEKIIPRLP
jgi:protein-tyrosine-phosphatase